MASNGKDYDRRYRATHVRKRKDHVIIGAKKTNGRQRKQMDKPEFVHEAEQQFHKCPRGHHVGTKLAGGICTPLHCGGNANDLKKKSRGMVRIGGDAGMEAPAMVGGITDAEERIRLSRAQSRRLAAREFLAREKTVVPYPVTDDPAEAEQFADRKAVSLLPEAMAELEIDLKYGDETVRREARRELWSITGRAKRQDSPQGNAAMIILVQNGQGAPQKPAFLRPDADAVIDSSLKPYAELPAGDQNAQKSGGEAGRREKEEVQGGKDHRNAASRKASASGKPA